MKPSMRNSLLLIFNLGIWILNVLIVKGTIQLAAKGGTPVSIEIEPARVRLTIDGKLWSDRDSRDGWIQTPSIIHLPPGHHKVVVERPGYAIHSFKVLLSAGDSLHLKTALEFSSPKQFGATITGEETEIEDVYGIVDGGLEEGLLPIEISDLTPGAHTLELKFGGLEGLRMPPYTCTFIISPSQADDAIKITVTRSGKRVKTTGCKRIKKQT